MLPSLLQVHNSLSGFKWTLQLIWIILSSSRLKEGWEEEEGSEDSGEVYLFSEIYFYNRCGPTVAHLVFKVLGRNFISECVPVAPRARNGSSGTVGKHNRGGGTGTINPPYECLSEGLTCNVIVMQSVM